MPCLLILHSQNPSSATSTLSCAALNAGACGACGPESTDCSTSAPSSRKKPAQLIEQDLKALREDDRLTPDLVFRDPYMLDFLGLRDTYSEQDLESALHGRSSPS